MEVQSYPDHPDRFDGSWPQLLCGNVLTGRCYWEVEWSGDVDISVNSNTVRGRGDDADGPYGWIDQSCVLTCSDISYAVSHIGSPTVISFSDCSTASHRAAVYVDRPAGTLSFYRVSSDTLIHLHTFNTTFTEEPLCAGFGFCSNGSSVTLQKKEFICVQEALEEHLGMIQTVDSMILMRQIKRLANTFCDAGANVDVNLCELGGPFYSYQTLAKLHNLLW